jgi:hypothetical protein
MHFVTMKIAVVASLLGSAAAFAPAKTVQSSTYLQAYEDEIGAAVLPGGKSVFWDPLNFVSDQASFDKMRASEIKHCRVGMLAWLGYATTWNTDFRFPGCESFPGGHQAVLEIPPIDLLAPILAITGALELAMWKQKEGSFPGDFSGSAFPVGFGPFANNKEDETELRTNEILNGRAAMMGWLTLLVHEQIDGKPFIFFDHIEPYFPGPNAIAGF